MPGRRHCPILTSLANRDVDEAIAHYLNEGGEGVALRSPQDRRRRSASGHRVSAAISAQIAVALFRSLPVEAQAEQVGAVGGLRPGEGDLS